MRKLYLSAILTELFTLFGQLIVYRLTAAYLGRGGFSEYALARRTIAVLQPAVSAGLGVAIPRYIAFNRGEGVREKSVSYFAAGLVALAIILTPALILLNVFKSSVALLLFGNVTYADLILPVSLTLLGLTLHSASYGCFRGNLEMTKANLLQFITHGMVPLISVLLFGRSTRELLIGLGTSLVVTSSIALLFTQVRIPCGDHLIRQTGELLGYGLTRVPADLAQLGFLALPAILVAHVYGVEEAGYLAFGISMLTTVASLFLPVGTVLLSEASQMASRGDRRNLRRRVLEILRLTCGSLGVVIVLVEIFARPIFTLYLGSALGELAMINIVAVVRTIILAALPYGIYSTLKNVLDASSVRAINSKNMLIAIAVFLAVSSSVQLGFVAPVRIRVFFVIGFYVLGILTLLDTKKVLATVSTG